MFPAVAAFCITPVCPHMLTNRPVLVPDTSVIEIVCQRRDNEAFLTVDGQVGEPLFETIAWCAAVPNTGPSDPAAQDVFLRCAAGKTEVGREVMKRPSLTAWIFIAMLAGVALGAAFPERRRKRTGWRRWPTYFLRLIKSIIAPLIFGTLVYGIAGTGSVKTMGRIGLKAIVYFEVLTTIALFLGLGAVNLVRPGEGMTLERSAGETGLPQTGANAFGHAGAHVSGQRHRCDGAGRCAGDCGVLVSVRRGLRGHRLESARPWSTFANRFPR